MDKYVCKILLPNLRFVNNEQCVLVSSFGVRLFAVYCLQFIENSDCIKYFFQEVSCVLLYESVFYFLHS
jgi:hypothetical protein